MHLLPLLASLAALIAYAPHAQAQQGELLRVGMRDDPDILDPTFSRTYVGTVVMTALCDKLFDFDAKLNIVPVLATGYDASAVKYSLELHINVSGSLRR